MFKKLIMIAAILCIFAGCACADVYVRGYTKSNGTYVAPHYRSSPNNTKADNWSTKGNQNPYTGKGGTQSPSYGTSPSYSPSFGSYDSTTYGNNPLYGF